MQINLGTLQDNHELGKLLVQKALIVLKLELGSKSPLKMHNATMLIGKAVVHILAVIISVVIIIVEILHYPKDAGGNLREDELWLWVRGAVKHAMLDSDEHATFDLESCPQMRA
eukprot:4779883-Amphidinium_carterae.1